MRFGTWRGATLALAVAAAAVVCGRTATVEAKGFHTIPRETLARDARTGGVAMAPPIPYGEYTKDYVGCLTGPVSGLVGRFCMLCGKLGCLNCGGLGHHNNGQACGSCGGDGCGTCGGQAGQLGDPGHGHGHGSLFGGHTRLLGHKDGGGLLHHGGSATGMPAAGSLCGPGQSCAAPQGAAPSAQGIPTACSPCGGKGCGLCGGKGWNLLHRGGNACGSCGGRGCGLCGGSGLFGGHGGGESMCGSCGGRGCGLCGGRGKMCGSCGGKGCGLCLGKLKSGMGLVHGMIGKVLHKGEIEYFVGPGGPVPITPGYVPYVVPVRSPRDFFAFPPFLDQATN